MRSSFTSRARFSRSSALRNGSLFGYIQIRFSPREEHHDFLQSVVMDSHSSGNLYLAKLCVDGTTIAVLLGFLFKGRMDAVVTTYDSAWQSYSPGRILMEESLKWSFEKQVSIFDFR